MLATLLYMEDIMRGYIQSLYEVLLSLPYLWDTVLGLFL